MQSQSKTGGRDVEETVLLVPAILATPTMLKLSIGVLGPHER
jgi:hypothetical protein